VVSVRTSFEHQLDGLEVKLLGMGQMVREQLARAVKAVTQGDVELAREVLRLDEDVDRGYVEVEEDIIRTLALQAPVAKDLRLVVAVVLINHHLERMGDLCVNIAKFARAMRGNPPNAPIQLLLEEMCTRAQELVDLAMRSFAERDLELAESLPIQDEPLDRLHRRMFSEIERSAIEEPGPDPSSEMILISRYLERLGDHSVDIGEQVGFVLTGEIREFIPSKAARALDDTSG
jgi:phosphate transport system protein